MFDYRSVDEWKGLWRYYQAGIVNALFGFGLYALFVRLGLNIYIAQICSHILGVLFNYFTYSRYAFTANDKSAVRFILSYIVNYFMSLMFLAGFSHVIKSPYVSGLATIIIVSMINYFILKRLVFSRRISA